MQPSVPNEHGVLEAGYSEVVASRGRAYAAITIALREDGTYGFGLNMIYSHGGFGFPITENGASSPTKEAARTAALTELLKHLHRPFPSEPQSVRDEIHDLRKQVESHIRQPSLF